VRRSLALAVAFAALGLPAAAVAADCPKTTLGDVEDEVMCPVCGTPLNLATEAPQAQRERALIQRLIDRCQSKEQVKTALAAEYGNDVLALPGNDGFDLAAYLVPGFALLLGGGALAFAAARWRRGREARITAAAPGDGPAAGKKLDADIERYDL
jgi:cytochrome c-type biogenesis protein CcmH/NrfF